MMKLLKETMLGKINNVGFGNNFLHMLAYDSQSLSNKSYRRSGTRNFCIAKEAISKQPNV
jgi:hypothetical protein